MTDEELQSAEKYAGPYIAEYEAAIQEGKTVCQMSFWGGFNSGRMVTRVLIAERLLAMGSKLSLDELAAVTFLNAEAVIGLQTRMMNDESKRLKHKQQINEEIAKNKKFTISAIEKQAAIIVELRKDLTFLFRRIDALNEVQDSISTLLNDAKDTVWCENDINERNRIYSGILQNIVDTLDEYTDNHTTEHTDKYIDITQKYIQIIHQNKSQLDKDDDDNDISED